MSTKTYRKIVIGIFYGFMLLALTVVPSLAADVPPLPDVNEADGSLGTCYTFYEEDLPAKAYNAGSRWDRFDFRWNVIEDTRGNFSFGPHDTIVNRDGAAGIDVVGILGSTAKWATSNCDVKTRTPSLPHPLPFAHPQPPQQIEDDYWWRPCPPDNLYLPFDDPNNYWGNYVYQVVNHFKGRVTVWEIWNEPDLYDVFWTGTPAEYAQLLKVGYLAAKAADPDATVLFAGLAYWANPTYATQVFDELVTLEGAAENNTYFDVLSLHLYSNVYTIRDVANELNSNMAASGIDPHPIWLTETGVPLWDEHPSHPGIRYDWAATVEEAAAYTIEAYAEARSAGIEKFFFFRLHDDEMSEAFGLIRNDRTLRPAYVAYQVSARYLQGENQITGPFSYPTGERRITFWGTPQGRIDILWNTSSNLMTATHPAILPTATLISHRGITQTLIASNGVFSVPLQPATAYLASDPDYYFIGGPPILIKQEDTEAPVSALKPINPGSFTAYLPDITLTWDASDALSGYWYEEIEIGPTATGPWERIAGYPETDGETQITVSLPEQGTIYQPWYFRSRARDRAGNWESWPASAEIDTDFSVTTTAVLSVTVYGNADNISVWLPLADVTMTWKGYDTSIITQTTGTSWVVTREVQSGIHHLDLHHPAYLPMSISFLVEPLEGEVQKFAFAPKLRFIRGKLYLPLILRNASGAMP